MCYLVFDSGLVTRLCLTLCNPMDCSLPGSSVHRIFQARELEWVAILFFRGSSQPRDRTQVSCTAGRFFTDSATREARLVFRCWKIFTVFLLLILVWFHFGQSVYILYDFDSLKFFRFVLLPCFGYVPWELEKNVCPIVGWSVL